MFQIRNQDVAYPLKYTARTALGREMGWRFLRDNAEAVINQVGSVCSFVFGFVLIIFLLFR